MKKKGRQKGSCRPWPFVATVLLGATPVFAIFWLDLLQTPQDGNAEIVAAGKNTRMETLAIVAKIENEEHKAKINTKAAKNSKEGSKDQDKAKAKAKGAAETKDKDKAKVSKDKKSKDKVKEKVAEPVKEKEKTKEKEKKPSVAAAKTAPPNPFWPEPMPTADLDLFPEEPPPPKPVVEETKRPIPDPPRPFPIVQSIEMDPGCCAVLDDNVQVIDESDGKRSELLGRAVRRVEVMLRRMRDNTALHAAVDNGAELRPVNVIKVQVVSSDETLNLDTTWEYSVNCQESTCLVIAPGVFGALGALQSLLPQLFATGGLANFRSLTVKDWPRLRVRGIMLDTGRRFMPVPMLKEHLEAMALVRMNFLQLHLSDFCRFALDLPGFPELRPTGLMAGQYSVAEMRDVLAFARDRGIRIVPEIDVPGHADGLLPLKVKGAKFCEAKGNRVRPEEASKLFDDRDGGTRAALKSLFEATAKVFRDEPWFHLGADETWNTGACNQESITNLEQYLVRDVIMSSMNKTAIGWEELLIKDDHQKGDRAAGHKDTILVAWHHSTARKMIHRGHRTIVAYLPNHYLDFSFKAHPPQDFWYNVYDRNKHDGIVCRGPSYSKHEGKYLGEKTDPNQRFAALDQAQTRCNHLGNRCRGVTCQKADAGCPDGTCYCEPRYGRPFLAISPEGESSWVKAGGSCSPEWDDIDPKALHDNVLGGISPMWTDRYCYIYQCGAADEFYGAQGGILPDAALMFLREFDQVFAWSISGMIWPRAGVTAAALWNYQPHDLDILERTSWLTGFLRSQGIHSCPPGCDCNELGECSQETGGGEWGRELWQVYPVIRWNNGTDEVSIKRSDILLTRCFRRGTSAQMGLQTSGSRFMSRTIALRLCFWRAQDCGGVMCQGRDEQGRLRCELRRPNDKGHHFDIGPGTFLVKNTDDLDCAPYKHWRQGSKVQRLR